MFFPEGLQTASVVPFLQKPVEGIGKMVSLRLFSSLFTLHYAE
jgi:hypothetical protein